MPDIPDAYKKAAEALFYRIKYCGGPEKCAECGAEETVICLKGTTVEEYTDILRENIPHGIDAPFEDVKAFQKAFGHPIGVHPQPLDSKEKLRRIGWMNEELAELANAETVEDQADAIIDLMYFAFGYLVEMGVPPSGVWNAVHKANMAKLWPDGVHTNDVGKVVKPPEWEGPDGEIREYIGRIERKGTDNDLPS